MRMHNQPNPNLASTRCPRESGLHTRHNQDSRRGSAPANQLRRHLLGVFFRPKEDGTRRGVRARPAEAPARRCRQFTNCPPPGPSERPPRGRRPHRSGPGGKGSKGPQEHPRWRGSPEGSTSRTPWGTRRPGVRQGGEIRDTPALPPPRHAQRPRTRASHSRRAYWRPLRRMQTREQMRCERASSRGRT